MSYANGEKLIHEGIGLVNFIGLSGGDGLCAVWNTKSIGELDAHIVRLEDLRREKEYTVDDLPKMPCGTWKANEGSDGRTFVRLYKDGDGIGTCYIDGPFVDGSEYHAVKWVFDNIITPIREST